MKDYPKCKTCGGPLWRRLAGALTCRICWLLDEGHAADVDAQSGAYGGDYPPMYVRRFWRGREAEANMFESLGTDHPCGCEQCQAITSCGCEACMSERAAWDRASRPRAILAPGPEPGSSEVIALLYDVLRMLSRDLGDGPPEHHLRADARIGHTRREVEETFARICPRVSL